MVNARGAQRESEGTVVVSSRATNNARGAKGPCGGNVEGARTREGMTGRTGSNSPDGRESIDKVRQLQRRLWRAAKQQPGRRFHALLDRIYRRDVLWAAWKLWEERMKMILNEYRLMPWQKEAQDLVTKHMEDFFFGESAALPPGYVPEQAK